MNLKDVPVLWPSIHSTEEESKAIKFLSATLYGFYYTVESWDAAFALYKFSISSPSNVSRDLARKWRFIAGHECVMEADRLRERLILFEKHDGLKVDVIATHMNRASLDKAKSLFNQYFPDIKNMRHAVAHNALVNAMPHQHAPSTFALSKLGEDGIYEAPWKGKMRRFDITDQTLKNMTTVVTTLLDAFVPAARELERLGHAD